MTITGPGGVGKTRFALAVASEAAEAFPDGVWFVPLAALRDPALVLPTVAEAIGADGDVARHIGDGACLLFLDNLEQVVEAAPGLGELAGECPRLRLLVTSREAMRIAIEREYPLSPLPESPSVELFRQRAGAVAPELEVEYETAVEICDRLDRLPLAIELAAARCKALSPEQILERLSESLDLLRGGRDADPRQQTLRTTIQWSYGLLSEEEQRVFRALSVFRGGCTLEAAETVCDADLDTLQSLVEKSLLRFTRERYWMLETIREFSRERVTEVGEADVYRHGHARYFLDRLGQAYGERLGPRRPEILEWYGAEVDNLRAMLDSLVAEAPAEAARATHQLFKFWRSLPAHSEAVERLETLLELKLADDLRAETLACLAEVRDYFGNLDAAWAAADEALRLAMPGTPARGLSLLIVASREVLRGNVDEGIRLAEQAATEASELEGPEIANATRGDVAMLLLSAGRREESRALMMDVIAEARTNRFFDERHMVGRLGFIDVLEADYESARRVLAYAVGQTRSVGNPWETWALQWLGYAYLGLGDRGSARATFGELLEISADAGKTVRPELAVALGGLARSVEQMDLREGARLAGAVAQLRDDSWRPKDVDVATGAGNRGAFRAAAHRRARRRRVPKCARRGSNAELRRDAVARAIARGVLTAFQETFPHTRASERHAVGISVPPWNTRFDVVPSGSMTNAA